MTTPKEHAAIKELFLDVVDLPEDEREARLAAAPDFVQEAVRKLVRRDSEGETPLDKPLAAAVEMGKGLAQNSTLDIDRIGPFEIVTQIGAGGMGVVYEAVEDGTGRHVALKLLAPGLSAWSGPKVRERFRREVQALGRLEHPGIARILANGELGEEAFSRPWFAMELVRGRELHNYVRDEQPTLEERVRLFAEITNAVAHAHERGIAHRDIKPANILIDEDGRAKVLDFGIARIVEDDMGTRLTDDRTSSFVGTLAYLPPENLDGNSGDGKRGDVYSLGCVLWETLFAKLPLPLDGIPLPAALRILREEEAPSPKNLRLRTTPDGSSAGRLPKDLAVILETAVAREPARRYQNAKALAEDLARYQDDLPIHARPPSAIYRTAKFARRNRVFVSMTFIVFAMLVTGIVATSVQAERARDSERRATAVRNFLLNDMLRNANPWRAGRVTVEDLLTQAQASMNETFASDPETLALLRSVLGETWAGLGNNKTARPLFEERVESLRDGAPMELARALADLAQLDLDAERPDLALRTLNELLALAPIDRRVEWLLGKWHSLQGDFPKAAEFLERAQDPATPSLLTESESDLMISILSTSANNNLRRGHYGNAKLALDQYLELVEANVGPASPRLAPPLLTRARIHADLGNVNDAFADIQRGLNILEASLGPAHPASLPLQLLAARLLQLSDRLDEGDTQLANIAAILPPQEEAPLLHSSYLAERGTINLLRDNTESALADLDLALELCESVLGEQHPKFAALLLARAPIHEWRGNRDTAIVDLERASKIFAAKVSPLLAEYAETEMTLGSFLMRQKRFEDGKQHLLKAVELFTKVRGPESEYTNFARHELAVALNYLGECEAALLILNDLLSIYERTDGPRTLTVAGQLHAIGTSNLNLERYPAAIDAYRATESILIEIGAPIDPNRLYLYRALSRALSLTGDLEEARNTATTWLEAASSVFGDTSPPAVMAREQLAEIDAASDLGE